MYNVYVLGWKASELRSSIVSQILSYQKTYTLAQLKLNFLTLQPESQFDFDKLISSFVRISFILLFICVAKNSKKGSKNYPGPNNYLHLSISKNKKNYVKKLNFGQTNFVQKCLKKILDLKKYLCNFIF